MRPLHKLAIPLAVVAAAALTTVYASADEASTMDWQPCDDGNRAQCAKLTVPIDHSRPGAETIDLALAKLPAQDPQKRRGTIIFNGGGPGPTIPTITDPESQKAFADLTRWFDVVTFDRRGYGDSAPLCDENQVPPVASILDSQQAYQTQQTENATYADSCVDDDPTLAEHVSAEDVAHDIEAVRQALKAKKIIHYGSSYGTVHGLEYAEHYGQHLDRLLLDSVGDHTVPYPQDMENLAPLMEDKLQQFVDWCDTDTACALHGSDVLGAWDEVVAAAEAEPLPTTEGEDVTHIQIRIMSTWTLDYEDFGAKFSRAIKQALDDGTGDGFEDLVIQERQDVGQLAWCADFPVEPDDYTSLAAAAAEARDVAPRVGWVNVLGQAWRCAGWPIGGKNPPSELDADAAPPALLVNGTLDAATHLAGARNVAAQLPDSALLPVTGEVHASYLSGNGCVRDAVHSYLLDGDLPEPGTECGAED